MVFHLISHRPILPRALVMILICAACSLAEERRVRAEPKPSATQPARTPTRYRYRGPAEPREQQAVQIFRLVHAHPGDVANQLKEIRFEKCRLVSDERTRSIIASGPAGPLAKLAALVKALDVPASQEPTLIRIFPLEHLDADRMADTILGLLRDQEPQLRCGLNEAGNSIIVQAPVPCMEKVDELVRQLDHEPTGRPASEHHIKVYELKYADFNDELCEAVDLAMGGRGQVAFNADRRQVIAAGDRSVFESLGNVLKLLDTPSVAGAWSKAGCSLRVLWLVSGIENLPAPPPDFQEVTKELDRIGVSDPGLVVQMLVRTSATDEEFGVHCAAVLDGRPCEVNMEGTLREALDEAASLRIEIRAEGRLPELGDDQRDLCHLETEVVAPLGHPVVLGVTPVGERTSVFVLQVLPDTPK